MVAKVVAIHLWEEAMSKNPETRIVARKKPGTDQTEIILHDPKSGQVVRTGHMVPDRHAESEIMKTKESLERAGHHPGVIEQESRE
jgi:hypothetical protein